ncbi:PTS sugar transporter subunit IIA [soil metagenome]
MNISSFLDRTSITAGLKADDKNDIINELVDLLEPKVNQEQLEKIRKSVFDREQIMSTGVGKQLAIPHGKCSSIDEIFASFAILDEPIEFNSIDNKPVKMVFLLVGPERKCNNHIKLLSRISRLMNSSSFREKLLNCQSADEIYETFQKEEKEYFGS